MCGIDDVGEQHGDQLALSDNRGLTGQRIQAIRWIACETLFKVQTAACTEASAGRAGISTPRADARQLTAAPRTKSGIRLVDMLTGEAPHGRLPPNEWRNQKRA